MLQSGARRTGGTELQLQRRLQVEAETGARTRLVGTFSHVAVAANGSVSLPPSPLPLGPALQVALRHVTDV